MKTLKTLNIKTQKKTMSYHVMFNVVITVNLICVFFFVANTWKYTLHAIQDIESYPMHENPEVIDLLNDINMYR